MDVRRSLDIDGRERRFLVVTPDEPRQGLPLVLAFHGSNQTADNLRRFSAGQFDSLADHGTAVVVYLEGYQKHWNDARLSIRFSARTENIDDVAFTRAVIADVASHEGIDPAHVYAIGYSNGGQMVNRLIHEAPELLAGAMMISATQPVPENLAVEQHEIVPVPLLLIHGTRDPLVPYAGGMATLPFGLMPRGLGLSAPATRDYFAARNGDVPVELVSIDGGGHTIPGGRTASMVGPTVAAPRAVDRFAGFIGAPLTSRMDS